MSNFNFSKDYEIAQPKKDTVIPVPLRTWLSLKNDIDSLDSKDTILTMIPSLAFGALISSVITYLTTTDVSSKSTIGWICLISLGIGIVSSLFCKAMSDDKKHNAQNIIKRMNDIDSGYDIKNEEVGA